MEKCPESGPRVLHCSVDIADEIAANIEFLSTTEEALTDGEVLNVATLQESYESVMSAKDANS